MIVESIFRFNFQINALKHTKKEHLFHMKITTPYIWTTPTCCMSTYFSQRGNPLPTNSAAEHLRLEWMGELDDGFSSSTAWRVLAVRAAVARSMTSGGWAFLEWASPLYSLLNSAPIIPRIMSAVDCCC